MATNTNKLMQFDLQKIVTLATIIGTFGGFYYLTNYRIEELEKKVEDLATTHVEIAKLEVEIKNVKNKTDEIYKLLIEDRFSGNDR